MQTLVLSLLLLFAALPTAAKIDCRTSDFATRLLSLQLELSGDVDSPAAQIDRLRAALWQRPDHLGPWGQDTASDPDTLAVIALVQLSFDVVSSDGKGQTLRSLLMSTAGQTIRREASLAVLRAACATSTGERSIEESALQLGDVAPHYARTTPGGVTADNGPGRERSSFMRLPALATGMVAMILSGLLVMRQIYRLRRSRQRRIRRYSINRTVLFRVTGTEDEGQLIDINCFGLKVYHGGALPPASATAHVLIHEKWRHVRIVWQNAHYAGGTFMTPLGLTELLKLVARSKTATADRRKPSLA